ncbi:MAG: biopolymer transporter ExbD [Pirellulales bacterium]
MPLRTHLDEQPTLNLTSMIDVLFLLIIFFMVGTKFTEMERKIGLKVPQVSDVEALTPAPEKKVVNVYRDGQVAVDRENVSLEELTRRLSSARSQYADLGVLVRGDGDGAFQHVAEVLNACRKAGVTELGVAVTTEKPDTARRR